MPVAMISAASGEFIQSSFDLQTVDEDVEQGERRVCQRVRNTVGGERRAEAANQNFLGDVARDDESGDGNAFAGIDENAGGDIDRFSRWVNGSVSASCAPFAV